MADSRKKILLCEDTPYLQELLAIAVRDLGCEIIVATDGQKAVELASGTQPDLILMDVALPKFNGLEATLKIKQNEKTMHIPIVLLTALRVWPEIFKRALLSRTAAEIMQKPIALPAIEDIVRRYLSVRTERPQ
jgi:CheY-like chemotaxis protein